MSPQFSKSFARLARHEDGLSAVEYAVMLALLVVGCVVAFLIGGPSPSTGKKSSTIAIKLRDDSDRTVRIASEGKSGSAKRPTSSERQAASGSNVASARSNGARPEKKSEAAKAQVKAGGDAKTGNAPTFTSVDVSENKTAENESAMNADDARQAILGLLKAYPSSFATSAQDV